MLVAGGFGVLVARGLKVAVGGGSGVSVGGMMVIGAIVGIIVAVDITTRVEVMDGVTVTSDHHGVGLSEATTVGGGGSVLVAQNSPSSASSSGFSTIS